MFECGAYFCLNSEACVNQQPCGTVDSDFYLGRTRDERGFHTIECEGTVVVTMMIQDNKAKWYNGDI